MCVQASRFSEVLLILAEKLAFCFFPVLPFPERGVFSWPFFDFLHRSFFPPSFCRSVGFDILTNPTDCSVFSFFFFFDSSCLFLACRNFVLSPGLPPFWSPFTLSWVASLILRTLLSSFSFPLPFLLLFSPKLIRVKVLSTLFCSAHFVQQ